MALNLPGIVTRTFVTLGNLGLTAPALFERPASGYDPRTGLFGTPAVQWTAPRAVEIRAASRRNAPDARFREAALGLFVPAEGLGTIPTENDRVTFASVTYVVAVTSVVRQGGTPIFYEIGANA